MINTPKPMSTDIQLYGVDVPEVRRIIDRLPGSGYLNPEEVRTLLRAANIPLVEEYASDDRDALLAFCQERVKYQWWCKGCRACAEKRYRWCGFEYPWRGQKGIDEQQYADIIVRLSTCAFCQRDKGNGYKSVEVATDDRGLFAVTPASV